MVGSNNNYDPNDPWADTRLDYETKQINNTRARRALRRNQAQVKVRQPKPKRPSSLSRLKAFFRELPDREDKNTIYRRMILSACGMIGLILCVVIVIWPAYQKYDDTQKETTIKEEINNLNADLREATLEGDTSEKLQLETRLKDTMNHSSLDSPTYFSAASSLAKLYSETGKDAEAIRLLGDLSEEPDLPDAYKIEFLLALITIYRQTGDRISLIKAIDKALLYNEEEEIYLEEGDWREIRSELMELKRELADEI